MRREILQKLSELGAGETAHVNGSLLAHLQGTHDILAKWGNRPALCDAGLYHAVYGTAGFGPVLIGRAERDRVASLIGSEAEDIVYTFCACDREYFYRQILTSQPPEYRDRFTGARFMLAHQSLRGFCELTMANQLEIVSHSAAFPTPQAARFRRLFAAMKPYVSEQAFSANLQLLGAARPQISG